MNKCVNAKNRVIVLQDGQFVGLGYLNPATGKIHLDGGQVLNVVEYSYRRTNPRA